jgi:hypothetical protein
MTILEKVSDILKDRSDPDLIPVCVILIDSRTGQPKLSYPAIDRDILFKFLTDAVGAISTGTEHVLDKAETIQ